MAIIQQREQFPRQPGRSVRVADKVRDLEHELSLIRKEKESLKKSKEFKFPAKWNLKFKKSMRVKDDSLILVLFFNKKGEIEPPRFMPIFDGNMIVYKDKPYEFDPRAFWRMKGVRRTPSVYCIREIDRRPIKNPDGAYKRDRHGRIIYSTVSSISNLDIEEVRARNDCTDSDSLLIKAAIKAQTNKTKKAMNMKVALIVIVILVALGIWLFSSGGTPAA